jgi:glutamate N-acetyltransferase/amino-acid N-acetyltransferase
MATMIAVVMTDAALPVGDLRAIHRRVTNTTFNCVSVDTDTSTSDTAVLLASGHHPVDPADMERALADVQGALTRAIAADGEGAETLIEVRVDGARDDDQAKRVAKSIVNSPLVKTAIHGADPNWGRVAMAIGKCNDHDIVADACVISFGGVQVYPRKVDDAGLAELENYLRGPEVTIEVDLHIDRGTATVWGCDLTDGYIRINADYTT